MLRWCSAVQPRALIAFLLLLSALQLQPANAEDPEFDAATGYRISRYRSPVPESVAGGTRITAAEVLELVKNQKAVLLDVMPSDGAGLDAATGEWHMTKPRQNIPGSVWLPDVGRGQLSPSMETYFRGNLEKLTAGERSRSIIIYCQSDCWMSWNAVKRAAGYGYTSLYWFPEGSDGWRDWDGTFSEGKPVPLDPTAKSAAQDAKPGGH
jgi:PQQ-dependent catabolism-associated CXXCW motif protein